MTVLIGDNTQTSTTAVGPNTFGDIEFCSYDASGNLLGSSNQITSVSGWNHATFSPAVSITSGTTYQLAICADDAASNWQMGMGAAAGSPWHYDNPASAFFPNPPSTLTTSGAGTANTISLYLTSGSGVAYQPLPYIRPVLLEF